MKLFAVVVLMAVTGFTHAIAPNTIFNQEPELSPIHDDITGNTIAATDASDNVVYTEQYRPYGERLTNDPASKVGQLAGNRIWFHGKVQDEATGLQYFGARYYDPAIGRFMGVDSAGIDPGNLHSFNRYAYGNNNPYRYRDPDGRAAAEIFVFFGVGEFIILSNPNLRKQQSESLGRLGKKISNAIHNEADNPNEGAAEAGKGSTGKNSDDQGAGESHFPDRPLPRDKNGNPTPDTEAEGAHTQLGQKQGRKGKYDQGREFDANGKPVRDIDFTDHGRPSDHPNPHQHRYLPASTGGTPMRGPTEPLQ